MAGLDNKTKIKYFTGIRVKLTIIILCVTLIPLGLLGYWSYNTQKEIITREVTGSHIELSNTIARGIYENLEFTRRLLNSIGELKVVQALNPEVTEDYFNALTRHFSFFKLMYLIDSGRKIIASTEPNVSLPEDWLFSKAVKRSYQGSLSEVRTSLDGPPTMTLESVIRSPNMGINGVLISEVNLSSIKELLKNALKNSKSQGLVFDEVGAIIARSDENAGVSDVAFTEVVDSDITSLKTINGESYLLTAVSLKKFDFYQAPNWTIVLQVPERIAFAAAYRFRERMLSVLGLTALISIIIAILLARGFTVPIGKLVEGASNISQGNYDKEMKPTSSDEIGELTQIFDEMRINIKNTKADLDDKIMQLSTLYEVGKAVTSELNFVKLQNMILDIVAKVLRAEKGSLMLIDDAEKTMTIGVAIGLSEEITRDTRLEVGDSVAGWAVKNRKFLFVKNVEEDEVFLNIKKQNIKAGTLMCAPLISKDKIMGALNVSKATPGSFSDNDFELFVNLANQVAIAIDNARLYRYAVTDEMTKLYNHRYFQQRLDEELLRADRYEDHISLLILDVDHFKHFNDTYGHPEGDRVLKTVARLIEKSIREIDIAARYGGEEFVVVCPEKSGTGALVPAERIRKAIEGFDFRINGVHVPITVSVGAACYPDNATTKAELIKKSDTALYYSKENGRNRSTLYNPIMVEHKD
ncbi:MAG: diguanylate cyclase [Candidatus Riflebacteria bacterium]|nr:diguanylate cyclase [Candidatus Riflebacteria bacterium]